MLYKTDEIAIGKTIDISIGSHTKTYTVCGFFNSVMFGSHNCVLTEIVLTEDLYSELENSGYAPQATLCSIRLGDRTESVDYEASLKNVVSEHYPDIIMVSNGYNLVSLTRYISQIICSGIVSAMAFFILLIVLVVIVSDIVNYIHVNMKNLGALKAQGYTSLLLRYSLLLQFLGLTSVAAVTGIGLSYLLFPVVNAMMISQTGIPYSMRFLPLPFIISLIILIGVVSLVVWGASNRIKRIEPILALRSGIQTHSFKSNHIIAPLNLALALKNMSSGLKFNITIAVTTLVLSIIVVFSGLMFKNMIMDITPFLNLIAGETADSCINVEIEEEDFFNEANADNRVEKLYLYNSLNVSHVGGDELMAMLCDNFSKVNNQRTVFEGRFPKYDNEIAIAGKYAKENGFEIGDEIEITENGKREMYLIFGFTQISNNLDKDCLLTRAGYERLGMLTNTSYYIDLTDNTDIDAFNQEIKEKFGANVNATINVHKTIEGSSSVYVSLMTMIVTAILTLSALIITFVLYLLVRIMLNNKKLDYGILKSLGFTTGQLILQTALSFMPTIILSTVVGLILSALIINPLMSLFLSGIDVVKCTFTIPIGFIMIGGIGLILFAFAMACLLSLKIRKIAPRALLVGE